MDTVRFLMSRTARALPRFFGRLPDALLPVVDNLAYSLGALEIVRRRREAEREFGARFDIRAFHDMVREDGQVPLGRAAGEGGAVG